MARLPRISPVGVSVHVIQRGNNRQACFGAVKDYSAYLGWLKAFSTKFAVDIHAWVLMTNHIHLLCTPQQEGSVSLMMQSFGRRYVITGVIYGPPRIARENSFVTKEILLPYIRPLFVYPAFV